MGRIPQPYPTIYLVGDNDTAGQQFNEKVAASLRDGGYQGEIRLVELSKGVEDVNDLHKRGPEAFKKVFTHLLDSSSASFPYICKSDEERKFQKAETPPKTPLAVSVEEFMESGPDSVAWLVADLIPEGGLAILAARPKAGKSLLTTNLALAVAKGGTFLGRECKRTNTLILQLEDPPTLIRERLKKMGIADGAFIRSGLLFTDEEWKELPSFITENHIGLVVVDPLVFASGGGDENDAAKMSRFFLRLREIIFATGATIVVVHHHRKSPGEAGDQIRGSSAILGAVDVALELVRETDITPTATLKVTSRLGTVEDEIIRLKVDTLTWESAGNAENYRNGQREMQLLAMLEAEGESTVAELEQALGTAVANFRPQLKNLVAKGLVDEVKLTQEGRGRRKFSYRLATEFSIKGAQENQISDIPEKSHSDSLKGINDNPVQLGLVKNIENSKEPELTIKGYKNGIFDNGEKADSDAENRIFDKKINTTVKKNIENSKPTHTPTSEEMKKAVEETFGPTEEVGELGEDVPF